MPLKSVQQIWNSGWGDFFNHPSTHIVNILLRNLCKYCSFKAVKKRPRGFSENLCFLYKHVIDLFPCQALWIYWALSLLWKDWAYRIQELLGIFYAIKIVLDFCFSIYNENILFSTKNLFVRRFVKWYKRFTRCFVPTKAKNFQDFCKLCILKSRSSRYMFMKVHEVIHLSISEN